MQQQSRIGLSPFILLLPFLLLYVLVVLYFHTNLMEGDEARYLQFAQNLLNGFYSPEYPRIDLINGPGYPIILMPFVALKLPLITITFFNAVLHYLSVVYVYKSIQLITISNKTALIIALCWGFNILAYQEMPCILTESLTSFLVALFSFQVLYIYKSTAFNIKALILTGFTLGFLALTKVIFAYVILILLAIAFFIYLLKRTSVVFKKLLVFSLIAFITLCPYIIYTYSITGKIFYLSSEGGKVLYWMTSLNENEYGDWNNNNFDANCHNNVFCNAEFIAKNHATEIDLIEQSSSVLEADSLFKVMAIANIKAHPIKYVKNWFANIGRLLYGFPASYYFQSPTTLVRIYINSILLLAMVYSLIVSLWNWKNIPLEIKILVSFSIIYLGLSSLVSAYPRQLNVMVPAILIWVCYAVNNSIKIHLKISKMD